MKYHSLAFAALLSWSFLSCGGNNADKQNGQTTANTTNMDSVAPYIIPENNTVLVDSSSSQSTTSTSTQTVSTNQQTVKTSSSTSSKTTSTTGQPTTTVTTSTASTTTINNNQPPITTTTSTSTTTTNPTTTTTKTNVVEEPKTSTKPMRPTLSHDIWEGLLQKYVNAAGKVNYAGMKSEMAKVNEYLTHLADNAPAADWSKNKEMAYWINLYNAFTIKLVLSKYPINSIMDLSGGNVWKTDKIEVGGKSYTLDNIEKDMLLRKFKEPRVHFAVNCAAASCPPLLNHAWTEGNVLAYYDQQAKAFINNASFNNLTSKPVELSQIFNWYADDFGGAANVLAYINKYATTAVKTDSKTKFKEYDWKLNKQ